MDIRKTSFMILYIHDFSRKIKGNKKEFGIEIDHKQSFGGKSHENQHLFRAVKIAKYLSEKIDFRSDIVEASA